MEIWNQFVDLVNGYKLSTLAILILVNLILGLVLAVTRKDITLSAVGGFVKTRVIPFVLGYLTVGIVATVDDGLEVSVPVVWGFIVASLVGIIMINLKELGLPLPDILAKKKES
jgi:hypothetical protein